jgi:uncharacterized protein YybS (DUF2232 family)
MTSNLFGDRTGPDKFTGQQQLIGILVLVTVLTVPITLPEKTGWLTSMVPIPVLFILLSFGNRKGTDMVLKSLLVSAGIALLSGNLPMLIVAASMVPLGFIYAQAAWNGISPNKTCLHGIIYLIGTWVLFWVFFKVVQQINIYTALRDSIDLGLVNALKAYSEMPDLSVEKLAQIDQTLQVMRSYIPMVLPSLLISSVIYTVTFNLVTGSWLLALKKGHSPWPPFSQWRLPENLVWCVIGGGLIYLLLPGPAKSIGLNILHIGGAVYFLEGLALLGYLLTKWKLPRLLKIIIFIVTVSQLYGFLLLAIAGLADTWVDFRKIGKNNTTEPETD